jgi:hypothetical protein
VIPDNAENKQRHTGAGRYPGAKMNDLTVYNKIKDLMHTGDGLGFQNTAPISRLIMWRTRKDGPIPLCHWGGIVRIEQFEGVEQSRYTLEAPARGFLLYRLSEYIKRYPGHIYWYPLRPEFEPYRNEIGKQAISLIGTPYDYLNLVKQAIIKCNANARAMFCSEAWQIITENAARHLCNKQTKALTPAAMWKLGCYNEPIKII